MTEEVPYLVRVEPAFSGILPIMARHSLRPRLCYESTRQQKRWVYVVGTLRHSSLRWDVDSSRL